MLLISLLLNLVLQVLLLTLIMQLEAYHVVRLRIVLLALAWGFFAGYMANQVEFAIIEMGLIEQRTLNTVIAPILEEGLKFVFFIALYVLVFVRYSGDALIYGFAVGSGYAIFENSVYILVEPVVEIQATGSVAASQILGLTLVRTISSGLMHAGITAIAATTLGVIVYYRPRRALLAGAGILAGAMLMHAAYNIVLAVTHDTLTVIAGLAIGMIILAALIALMNYIMRQTYNQILKELRYDPLRILSQTVTEADREVGMLQHLRQVYGRKQAKLVESYLLKQGQLALYIEHLDNGDQRSAAVRSLERLIRSEQARMAGVYDRMEPVVQQWLQEARLYDALESSA